ncbi:MAG TPA: glycosyltransferase, partial [Anaerolineae bacterium]|nr:glycosyltransferase [Anaerolineae bacterium]
REYPYAGVVGPKVVYLDNPETIQFADYRWYPEHIEHRGERDVGQYNFLSRTSHVIGCCMLYRRSVFARAGVFDIRFSPSQVEDPDHHFSVMAAGYDILFDGRITVKHPLTAGRKPSAAAAANSYGNFIKMEGKWGKEIFKILETGLDKSGRILVDERTARVSIIIPVFNKVALTEKCLSALYANTEPTVPFEVIIVDNGSTDDTPQFLQTAQTQYPNLRVISNAENVGFARACNQGAQAAAGEFILFLNNDTEVQPGWLAAMLNTIQSNPNAAVVGSKLLFPDGTIQHAGVAIVADANLGIPVSAWHIGYLHQDSAAFNKLRVLQAVTAACMLVKKEVFTEVGGFDEAYWNGYEDVDFCFKVGQAGYDIYYQPESVVIHYESQSGAERHLREDDNLQLLQKRWREKIIPDYVQTAEKEIYPNAAIVIVTYNSENSIRACLDSVLENTHTAAEIVVVDNASADGTRDILAQYGGRIRTILNNENLGFSAACNQGIRATRGDFVVLLNPDTIVTPGWLRQMQAHF